MESPIGGVPAPDGGARSPNGSAARDPQGGPGTPVLLPDGWVGSVTDRIVSTVDGVRAKTTAPIEKVGRVIVWGLLIATAGVGVLIALLVGLLRLVYEAVGNIPGVSGREGRSVWIIDILLGVVLICLGLLLITRGTNTEHAD